MSAPSPGNRARVIRRTLEGWAGVCRLAPKMFGAEAQTITRIAR